MPLVDYNSTSESENDEVHHQQHNCNNPSATSHESKQGTQQLAKNKKSKTIKITIPSLTGFTNDEILDRRQSKQLNDFEGLLTVLPPPKRKPLSNKSFIPNILRKKMYSKPDKRLEQTSIAEQPENNSQCNSDDDIGIPETFDDAIWKKACSNQKKHIVTIVKTEAQSDATILLAPEISKPYIGLNNKTFQDMVEQKRKRKDNLNLRGVSEDLDHPGNEQWLKSLTDPQFEPNMTIINPVNNTCRVKNHITALAQKALANNQALQLKWSENKYNRRLTQEKYGF